MIYFESLLSVDFAYFRNVTSVVVVNLRQIPGHALHPRSISDKAIEVAWKALLSSVLANRNEAYDTPPGVDGRIDFRTVFAISFALAFLKIPELTLR